MPTLRFLIRLSVRLSAVLLGLGLLSYLVLKTGPALIWKQAQTVGWGLLLIVILGGVSQVVQTCAWRQTFTCDISGLSWTRSLGVQLISDAAGQLGLAGKLLGDGLRVSLLGPSIPLTDGIAACAIDGGLHVLTAAIVAVLGIVATLLIADVSGPWRTEAFVVSAVLLGVVVLAAVSLAARWPLIGDGIKIIGRLPILHNWISAKEPIIDSAENNLLDFCRVAPAAFGKCVAFNFLWHALEMLEIFLILRFMGARVTAISAFVVEGLTKVINLVGVVNPGNVGTYEAGNMLIAKVLGVPATAGLTLALCRRARSIFWAAVGAICMIFMRKPKAWSKAAGATRPF